ncbi:unnamed protein product, partial [Polarella glacialis]
YLLLPHRLEGDSLVGDSEKRLLTDCFDAECVSRTRVLRDDLSEATRVFLQVDNPYAASFFMTKAQFGDYLSSAEWDVVRKDGQRPFYLLGGQKHVWQVREQAAGGLLWDRRFGPERAVTHLELHVIHTVPITSS